MAYSRTVSFGDFFEFLNNTFSTYHDDEMVSDVLSYANWLEAQLSHIHVPMVLEKLKQVEMPIDWSQPTKLREQTLVMFRQ